MAVNEKDIYSNMIFSSAFENEAFQDKTPQKRKNLRKFYDQELKIVLLGDLGVGKTLLFNKFINGVDLSEKGTPSTSGLDFGFRYFNVLNRRIKMQVWNTDCGSQGLENLMNFTR